MNREANPGARLQATISSVVARLVRCANLATIMRMSIAIASSLFLLAFAAPCAAADDREACSSETGKTAIDACGRAIKSGRYRGAQLAELYEMRGLLYRNGGDYNRAIDDFTQAIRLVPQSAEYRKDRATAYNGRGDYDRADDDYSRASELDPDDAAAVVGRSLVFLLKGEFDHAIAESSKALEMCPQKACSHYDEGDARVYRGLANLYSGSLPKALADFAAALEVDVRNLYTALWLDILRRRANQPSKLADMTALDTGYWPGPLARLYLGEITADTARAAANDPDPAMKRFQICTVNFFIGALVLQQGKKDEAARLFRLAAADCPKDATELIAANAELKALGTK
jgi:lipoprotein NlpI